MNQPDFWTLIKTLLMGLKTRFSIWYCSKKTSIRLELGIGLQALSTHNSLMLAGCFIKLIIHFFTEINKEKSSKKERVVIIELYKNILKTNLKVHATHKAGRWDVGLQVLRFEHSARNKVNYVNRNHPQLERFSIEPNVSRKGSLFTTV